MTTELHHAYHLLQRGQPVDALAILLNFSSQAATDPNVGILTAIAQSQSGDKPSAVVTYQNLLKSFPNHTDALLNLGADLYSLGRFEDAINTLVSAQTIDSANPMVALNLGNVYKALGQTCDALKYYDIAISLNQNYSEAWNNRGDVFCQLGQQSRAIDDYKEAIRLNPQNVEALNNLGLAYIEENRFNDGLNLVNRALALNPSFALAYNNLGIGLVGIKQFEAGIRAYQQAISLDPCLPNPYFNLGEVYVELRQFKQAVEHYELARLRSDKPTTQIGALLHTKMKICDWSGYQSLSQQIMEGLADDYCAISPFTILGLPSSAPQQKKCAETFSAKVFPSDSSALDDAPPNIESNNLKIRVGYLSSDLYGHATAYLMAELFELHNRERFEIFAFSYGTGPDDAMRARLVKAFDQFHTVQGLSDAEIADKISSVGIDILVDLKGHTQGARLGVMSRRPAPIQVHYLGYPGTLGTAFIDYLIADNYLIQPEDYPCYSEKIVHLPGSYQVNDRNRSISPKPTTRADHRLPANAFVYCCFNNNWKITPEIFDIWMRILSQNTSTVLWLLEDNALAAENLRLAAQHRGVDPTRLIFAPKLPLPEHLARHQHANLFLDTLYYNAHTTASDALWAGLPVLTVQGKTFASRVGGSLLTALNLPEMIAPDFNAYETRALEMAANPNLASNLRARLHATMTTAPLFDTPKFVRNLENAYETMIDRWRQGLPPDHIRVAQS